MSAAVINPFVFSSGGSWTPADASTVFWYDAADTSTLTVAGAIDVDAWADKSGNGYTLTVSSPNNSPYANTRTLNGLNVLEWRGEAFAQDIGTDSFTWNQANSSLRIAIVMQFDSLGTSPQYFYFHGTNSTTPGQRMSGRWAENVKLELLCGSTTTPNVNRSFFSSVTPAAGTPVMFSTRFNGTSSNWRVNGESLNTADIGPTAFNRLRFGHNETPQFFLEGFIAEVVGFTAGADQEKVEGYLAWKWGLQGNLPATHAYKTGAPQL